MNVPQHFVNALAVCRTTSQLATAKVIEIRPVTAGSTKKALWWQCSACDRWHILEIQPLAAKVITNESTPELSE